MAGCCIGVALICSLGLAKEYAVKVNVRPTPVQRALRLEDPQHPTEKERRHVPRLKITETTDRLLIEAQVPGHPMTDDDYLRGFMLYLDQVVISKVMFTPGNSVPRFYYEMEKQYLSDGQMISLVADCIQEDVSGIDFIYHQENTPNVYLWH